MIKGYDSYKTIIGAGIMYFRYDPPAIYLDFSEEYIKLFWDYALAIEALCKVKLVRR